MFGKKFKGKPVFGAEADVPSFYESERKNRKERGKQRHTNKIKRDKHWRLDLD